MDITSKGMNTEKENIRKGTASKKKFVSVAAELFWKQGYNATGISEILEIAGLPKGSFYFYFKSKKELAIAVESYYEDLILSWFREAALAGDWNAFARELSRILVDGAAESERKGCPLALVGTELALIDPEISRVYTSGMNKLRDAMCDILLSPGIIKENDAKQLSEKALVAYEGRLMLYRLNNDFLQLKLIETDLTALYQDNLTQCGLQKTDQRCNHADTSK